MSTTLGYVQITLSRHPNLHATTDPSSLEELQHAVLLRLPTASRRSRSDYSCKESCKPGKMRRECTKESSTV